MIPLIIPLVVVAVPDSIQNEQSFDLDDGVVRCVACSPDAGIVAGCGDLFVQLFDVQTGARLHRLAGHTKPVLSIAFTPDGKRLISSSADQTIRVWDVESGRQIKLLKGRSSTPVLHLAISGNGRWMATCWRGWRGNSRSSERHEIGLWDLKTGLWEHYQERFPELQQELATHVAFSPDGRRVAVSGRAGNVTLYQLNFGFARRFILQHEDLHEASWVAFSRDSRKLLSCGRDNTIRVWDVESGKPLLKITGSNEGLNLQAASTVTDSDRERGTTDMNKFDANRDGILDRDELKATNWLESDLARADLDANGSISHDEAIRRWTRMRRDELAATRSIQAAEFSPDGSRILSVTRDERIQIRDANSGRLLGAASGTEKAVSSIALSRDGKTLVTGGGEQAITLWRIE